MFVSAFIICHTKSYIQLIVVLNIVVLSDVRNLWLSTLSCLNCQMSILLLYDMPHQICSISMILLAFYDHILIVVLNNYCSVLVVVVIGFGLNHPIYYFCGYDDCFSQGCAKISYHYSLL